MTHKYITQLLEKAGVKSTKELTPDEQVTYDRWQRILSEGEVTVDSLSRFCESQKSMIEAQWKDLSNPQIKTDRLVAQHVVYSTILEAIKAPLSEREHLEKYLQTLISSKP